MEVFVSFFSNLSSNVPFAYVYRQRQLNQINQQNGRSSESRRDEIDLNSEEAKHRRRMEILTNVIHKVCMKIEHKS